MSLHFTLEYVTKGGVDENITKMFVDALFNQDGLTSPPPTTTTTVTKLGTNSWHLG